MNEKLNWEDLKLFAFVARAGGLAGAATTSNVSAPTLGRRMASLENATGKQLFTRHHNGYALTPDGARLLEYAEQMNGILSDLDRWLEQQDPAPQVKITAGAWTSRFIVQNIPTLSPDIRYRIMPDNHFFDLRRREAHLGIRNRRPTQQGLAVRKLGHVTFGLYGAAKLDTTGMEKAPVEECVNSMPCIIYEPNGTPTASSVWLKEKMTKLPALSCSSPTLVLDAATGGAGLCVLPCFVGDREAGLKRYSEPISELSHVQWLVSHDEDRHLKHVRQTADVLHTLITEQTNLFAGTMSSR